MKICAEYTALLEKLHGFSKLLRAAEEAGSSRSFASSALNFSRRDGNSLHRNVSALSEVRSPCSGQVHRTFREPGSASFSRSHRRKFLAKDPKDSKAIHLTPRRGIFSVLPRELGEASIVSCGSTTQPPDSSFRTLRLLRETPIMMPFLGLIYFRKTERTRRSSPEFGAGVMPSTAHRRL
jgi:hypothetical protein